MKTISKLFILIALVALSSVGVQAQTPQPIRWRTTVKMISATEGVVTVRALVSQGWHLYDTTLPEGGPRPTAFDFSASTGVKFIGAFQPSVKATSVYDEMFGMQLSYWSKNVNFTRRFRVTDASKAVINGKISYMACNGTNCMPPKTESVKVKVKK